MTIERRHGRIWFGTGPDEWSVTDPEAPEHKYSLRDLACEWNYIISACPTTEMALEKVRLIRRALRTVERQPLPGEGASDGKVTT